MLEVVGNAKQQGVSGLDGPSGAAAGEVKQHFVQERDVIGSSRQGVPIGIESRGPCGEVSTSHVAGDEQGQIVIEFRGDASGRRGGRGGRGGLSIEWYQRPPAAEACFGEASILK